jgi:hypothetical protein
MTVQESLCIKIMTGSVSAGDSYPAVSRVWMTRMVEGPEEGDIELSLAYRADIIVPIIGALLSTDTNGRFLQQASATMVVN